MKKQMIKNSGLHVRLLRLTLIPIIVMGIVMICVSYIYFGKTVQREIKQDLRNTVNTTLYQYDVKYPGEYALVKDGDILIFCKGKDRIHNDYEYLDKIKELTGVEQTFYFYDIRVLTTVCNEENERIIGTNAHTKVVEEVFKADKEKMYRNVLIDGKKYFAYYVPLKNQNGETIGMIAAGKSATTYYNDVLVSLCPILFITIAMMTLTTFICNKFTKELVVTITREKNFLKEVANGNLKADLDCRILQRKDELGEMGRFTVHVQKFIREMVERDALTKLYSRRIGDLKIRKVQEQLIENGMPFAIVMCDIDFFKKVNDQYGHDCGDLVLKETASIFNHHMLGKGFAVRWGGEEFLIIYENTKFETVYEDLKALREKIINNEMQYQDKLLKITMTFGIVRGSDADLEEILKEADNLLYEGKMGGRNRIVPEDINSC